MVAVAENLVAGTILKPRTKRIARIIRGSKAIILWTDKYQACLSVNGRTSYWGLKTLSQYFSIEDKRDALPDTVPTV